MVWRASRCRYCFRFGLLAKYAQFMGRFQAEYGVPCDMAQVGVIGCCARLWASYVPEKYHYICV